MDTVWSYCELTTHTSYQALIQLCPVLFLSTCSCFQSPFFAVFFLCVCLCTFLSICLFWSIFCCRFTYALKDKYSIQKEKRGQVICSTRQSALYLVTNRSHILLTSSLKTKCLYVPQWQTYAMLYMWNWQTRKSEGRNILLLDQLLKAVLRLPVHTLIWPLYHVPCFLFFLQWNSTETE